ncbi:histone deacetylase 3 [Fonticula alba]|uniref:histone deacetylase n=1 Tax=Fonticula alba TaxID=691883 RepID=A0A058Z2N4_FONAL|nr:histone deacetylase 3 [Fonticula alba]KCV68495.1 histone deacetylase 3 [Fonticula alba]|eukprot:XP_009496927.1 histone deacetylase 3 [Fonticula alba]
MSHRPAFQSQRHYNDRISYFSDPSIGNFHFGAFHPMKPHRIVLTHHLVSSYGLHNSMSIFRPRRATEHEMRQFHSADYIDFLKRVTPSNIHSFTLDTLTRFNFGDDCPVFPGMFDFCQRYAGGSLDGAYKLNDGSSDVAINWSGGLHHAKKFEASGFCYVNDIVLAILELLRVHARVMYIDIDVHHGDGVQEAFYVTDRVMTLSFHKYDGHFFPRTGDITEVGVGAGTNFSINVPLKDGIDDESYQSIFQPVVRRAIEHFNPGAIVLQCGADSLGCDRLGRFNLSVRGHGECVRFVRSFNRPTLVLGGGGYTVRNVARCWTWETAVVCGQDIPDEIPSNPYIDYFAPSFLLHDPGITTSSSHAAVGSGMSSSAARAALKEDRAYLKGLEAKVAEIFRRITHAPSVQMQELPPPLTRFGDDADGSSSDSGDEDHPGSDGSGGLDVGDPFRSAGRAGDLIIDDPARQSPGGRGSSRPAGALSSRRDGRFIGRTRSDRLPHVSSVPDDVGCGALLVGAPAKRRAGASADSRPTRARPDDDLDIVGTGRGVGLGASNRPRPGPD